MRRHLTLLLLLALLATACGEAVGSPRTAATINGEVITVDEVQPLIRAATQSVDPATGQALPQAQAAVQILSNLALQVIVDQQLAELGGEAVTEADVDEELATAVEQSGGQEAFDQLLASQGQTVDSVRQELRFQVGINRLGEAIAEGVEVADADVEAAYEQQFSLPEVSHILVETEEEAIAARERIDGGEDFAAVAQEISTDPGSGAQGGALGQLQPGAFVPEFEEAALALEPGELSQPVQTQFGFHLITVGEPQPLTDELREQITTQLAGQQEQQALTDLVIGGLLEADASVNPRFGRWAPAVSPQGGLSAIVVPTDPLGELVPVAPDLGGVLPVDPGAPAEPAAPPADQ